MRLHTSLWKRRFLPPLPHQHRLSNYYYSSHKSSLPLLWNSIFCGGIVIPVTVVNNRHFSLILRTKANTVTRCRTMPGLKLLGVNALWFKQPSLMELKKMDWGYETPFSWLVDLCGFFSFSFATKTAHTITTVTYDSTWSLMCTSTLNRSLKLNEPAWILAWVAICQIGADPLCLIFSIFRR